MKYSQVKVKVCCQCPMFSEGNSLDMYCGHPHHPEDYGEIAFTNDTDVFESIPDNCPLEHSPIIIEKE